tara:strand:- start:1425 stop:1907 length:483 start_codon:yes stop_codon:yes gene_type:complete
MTDAMQYDNKVNHRLFVVTLVAKGLLGLIQLMTAAAIFAGVAERLPVITQWLFKAELAENPTDFIATRIISLVGIVPTSDLTFYTAYFSAHGTLHIAIVIALLYGAPWAHHAAIFVLWVFVAYQMFEWATVGGYMLLVLSAIDLAVIYITLRERRNGLVR